MAGRKVDDLALIAREIVELPRGLAVQVRNIDRLPVVLAYRTSAEEFPAGARTFGVHTFSLTCEPRA